MLISLSIHKREKKCLKGNKRSRKRKICIQDGALGTWLQHWWREWRWKGEAILFHIAVLIIKQGGWGSANYLTSNRCVNNMLSLILWSFFNRGGVFFRFKNWETYKKAHQYTCAKECRAVASVVSHGCCIQHSDMKIILTWRSRGHQRGGVPTPLLLF